MDKKGNWKWDVDVEPCVTSLIRSPALSDWEARPWRVFPGTGSSVTRPTFHWSPRQTPALANSPQQRIRITRYIIPFVHLDKESTKELGILVFHSKSERTYYNRISEKTGICVTSTSIYNFHASALVFVLHIMSEFTIYNYSTDIDCDNLNSNNN